MLLYYKAEKQKDLYHLEKGFLKKNSKPGD